MSQSVGTELMAKVLQEERVQDFLSIRREFLYQDELKVYDFIKSFYDNHGTLPSVEVVQRKTKAIQPVATKDPFGYFYGEYTARALFNQFQSALPRIGKFLESRDMAKAVEEVSALMERTKSVRSDAQRDLTTLAVIGRELLGELAELRGQQGMTGIPTGWPTLDRVTMGLQSGDMYVILARPKMGKTITLLNMVRACHTAGHIPLVVSMEMRKHPIGRRLLGQFASLSMTSFRSGQLSFWGEQRLRQEVERLERQHPLYIIEGQFRKSIEEVASLVHGLMPAALYIDGGYLLKLLRGGNQMQLWQQMTEIAQGIKNVLSTVGIPGVVSFQYNRKVGRGATSGGFEDIQLSDAIGQLASVGIGVYEDPHSGEGIQSNRRYCEIVGGREGETGGFYFNWDWQRMDFSEIVEPDTDQFREVREEVME